MQLQCPHCGRWDAYSEVDEHAEPTDQEVECSYCSDNFVPGQDPQDDVVHIEIGSNGESLEYSYSDNQPDLPKVNADTKSTADATGRASGLSLEPLVPNPKYTPASEKDEDGEEASFGDTSLYSNYKVVEDRRFFGAGLLGFLLLLGLALQFAWWERDYLSRWEPARTVWSFACSKLPCEQPQPIAINQMRIERHLAVSAESNTVRLDLRAVLRNDAEFSQPYPDIRVWLDNKHGEAIAAGRFTSKQYLPTQAQNRRFAAGERLFVDLPIALPKSSINGYRLELLRPEA